MGILGKCFKVLCTRVLPIIVVFIAIVVGWLSQQMIPEGTLFATVIPIMKGHLPTSIFGPYKTPLTPEVPESMTPRERPEGEMFLNMPDGSKMPQVGLGMCCRASAYDDETVYRTVLWYLLEGGRHIDTADLYLNHKACGRGIKEAIKRGVPRSEIFVTTKIPARFYGTTSAQKAVLRYLKELGLQYIDLLLMHFPKQMVSILSVKECSSNNLNAKECRAATWKGLSIAREKGLVRNIGVSNFNKQHMEDISSLNLAPIAANQFQYNPWVPEWQEETFQYCQKNNIPVTAYSSLGSLMEKAKMFTVKTLKDIANEHSRSVAQILLRWALQTNAAVIPGTGNPKHMRENLSVYGFKLSTENMELINSLRDDPDAKTFFYMKMDDDLDDERTG